MLFLGGVELLIMDYIKVISYEKFIQISMFGNDITMPRIINVLQIIKRVFSICFQSGWRNVSYQSDISDKPIYIY